MANRRFEMYHYRQALVRMRQGESDRQIRDTGLMGRRTLGMLRKQAQQRGWLDPARALPSDQDLAAVLQRAKPGRMRVRSSLEPYRQLIEQWCIDGIDGTTIHAALTRRHGYSGSYSSVRRFLQSLAKTTPRVTSVLEFAPGEAAQVDFGKGPEIVDVHTGEAFKTWVFVMLLAWSRHQYAELVRDQSIETWLGCHRRAFEHFNGVPSKVIIDNPKCAITKACYHDPQVQRSYADYAEGYGFLISPCPVADPQKKGRVESGVKYVKNNFLPLREFRDLADANQQLMAWVMHEAGNRIHGTTRTPPLQRFVETERAMLNSLPNSVPESARWVCAKLHGDCHLQVDKCRYSAPWRLVGQTLDVRLSETTVRVYQQHELKAIHPRLTLAGQRHTVDEHLPPQHLAYKMRDPQWCLKQAEAIGSHCHRFMQRLFENRVLDRLRAAQGVIGLARRYGAGRLEAACQRALHFDNIQYRAVRVILEKSLDQHADPQQCFNELSDAYTGAGRFGRDTRKLFTKH
jgi:transposase